jgi:hypothetical protein
MRMPVSMKQNAAGVLQSSAMDAAPATAKPPTQYQMLPLMCLVTCLRMDVAPKSGTVPE